MSTSRVTGDLATYTFTNYEVKPQNKDAVKAALKFCAEPRQWLTFYGNYGPGKTHLLAAICNMCNRRKVPAMYICGAELMEDLREGYNGGRFHALLKAMIEVEVLCIDEFNSDRVDLNKSWARDKIVQIFEARYRNRCSLGTVFGMNGRPVRRDYTENDIFGWIYTRMNDRRFQVVHVGGGDYRLVGQRG